MKLDGPEGKREEGKGRRGISMCQSSGISGACSQAGKRHFGMGMELSGSGPWEPEPVQIGSVLNGKHMWYTEANITSHSASIV